jgi:hypothetical protein
VAPHLEYQLGDLALIASQAEGMALFVLNQSQSDMQLAFRNVSKGENYYQAKKHIREDPELLSDYLSDVSDKNVQ